MYIYIRIYSAQNENFYSTRIYKRSRDLASSIVGGTPQSNAVAFATASPLPWHGDPASSKERKSQILMAQ